MKKNPLSGFVFYKNERWKIFLIMRLMIVMLLGFVLGGHANGLAQHKMDVKMGETTYEELFQEIRKQTGCIVMYNSDMLNKGDKVKADFGTIDLTDLLERVLSVRGLTFELNNEFIIVMKAARSEDKAKEFTVTGTVRDERGEPMPGVTVKLDSTFLGTATDHLGRFSLQLPVDTGRLVFSFVGYKTVKMNFKAGKPLQVILEEDVKAMEEVVVTGYQKIDRRKNASSAISVKGSDMMEGSAISIDNMLQGKLAGVNIINPTSTPGAAPKIRIRGSSSISGNREPVWVVDGIILEEPVPISAEELNSLDNVNLIGNAIASINPEDIDRIDILKDASATAIYGVKAANGVIVITTKKGKIGKPVVHYAGNVGISLRPSYNNLHRMDSKERIDVSKEIAERGLVFGVKPSNIGYEGALYDLYSKKITQEEFVDRVYDLEKVNTDWYDELFRTDVSHKHSLSISGGTEKINYYFSAGYSNTNAVVRGSDMESYNGLLKLNIRLRDNLDVGFSLRAYSADKKYLHGSIDPYSYAYNTSRAIPAYNADGSYLFYNKTQGYETILNYNILHERENTGRKIRNESIDFMANVNYKIFSDLTFNGVFSLTRMNTKEENWANERSYYIAQLRGVNYGEELPTDHNFVTSQCQLPYGGELKNDHTHSASYVVRAGLNYYKRFLDRHEVDVNLGTEARSVKYDGISTVQWGYLPDRGEKFVPINPVEWPKYNEWLLNNPNVVTNRLTNVVSFYGTFTYTYDNRYTANFNIRTDGSNKFGQDKDAKFLPVWSVAARWNIHNESLFNDVMWMNLLAIKASYGVQGNVHPDQTPNLLVSIGSMDNVSKEYISSLSQLPNPSLRWEKTKSYNLGLEYAFLDNRINGSVEYYLKRGEDQIITKRVSTVTGKKDVSINGGDVENKGWELTIGAIPVKTPNFTWGLSVNMYKNYNKVTSKNQTKSYEYRDFLQGNLVVDSKPLDAFYSYKFDKLDEEGLPTFKDTDEPEGITKEEMFEKAFAYSGKRVADLNGGFSMYFQYKRLTLNCLFAFSIGKKVRLNNLYESSGQMLPMPQQNMSDEFVNRWRKGVNENTVIPALSDLNLVFSDFDRKYVISNNKWEMYNNSDLRVVSGDFLRMRSVSLNYNVSDDLCKKLGVSAISMRFEAGNLWLWANKKLRGQDPEQMSFGSGTVPPTRNFNFGLNISI
ncbi:SusC/RagA family TonB-linked outer membrane protein [uncultured Sanguibacteroides sp.]|uniref:SusC/RagA family TonB-linked outer membrane protein n=1 Tax=uncultured Sanguibacteroides sp. TaxID=1635151 RepID=UPI0025EAAFC7|nr:SusC/RagA family TonB-linked outer membrane protein [uncultured Sanguibacteroides sp.]